MKAFFSKLFDFLIISVADDKDRVQGIVDAAVKTSLAHAKVQLAKDLDLLGLDLTKALVAAGKKADAFWAEADLHRTAIDQLQQQIRVLEGKATQADTDANDILRAMRRLD